jgi:hypothetical protein
MVINHINNNTFDNRNSNLEESTYKANAQNKKKTTKKTISKYIGVSFHKPTNKWRASCCSKHLGLFENEIDAGIIYDKYALIVLGKNASINNLIVYDDIKNLTINDILKTKVNRKLPTNINIHNNKYRVSIRSNYILYEKNGIETLEDAMQILINFKKEIDNKKNLDLIEHNKKEITRDINDNAILYLYNNKKEKIGTTIVDDHKWHELQLANWIISNNYVVGYVNKKLIRLHRYLMNISHLPYGDLENDKLVDHIDNNTFNNKIENLRLVTHLENGKNKSKSKSKNCTSNYKGVSKTPYNKFNGKIQFDNYVYGLGNYELEIKAAIAYNLAAKYLFKEFANLNKITIDKDIYDEYEIEILNKWKTIKIGKIDIIKNILT